MADDTTVQKEDVQTEEEDAQPAVVPEDGTLVDPDAKAPEADPAKEDDTTEQDKEPDEEPKKKEEAPEESEEETEEKEEESGDPEYNEYEHPALKQAVNILKEAELPVDEANAIFAEAVETGDLTKINKDALVEKLGQDKADVVLVLAESYYNTQFSSMKAIQEQAYTLTGGEENFAAMKEWAADKAASDADFAKDLKEFRAMIDTEQPRAVTAAIRELFSLYKNDPDTTIEADLEVGDSAASKQSVEPMSLMDYTNAIEKAHKDGTYEKVRESLWARRKAGKKLNI